jgi:hypothetical protein
VYGSQLSNYELVHVSPSCLVLSPLNHVLCGAGKVYESQLSNYELVHVSSDCLVL